MISKAKLILKPAAGDDPDLPKLVSGNDILKYMSEIRSYGVPMPSSFIFRIEVDNKLIGEAKLGAIRWYNRKAELSLYIHPDYRNNGNGKTAIKKLMDHAFNEMDLHRLECEIYEYNSTSIHLAESLGFRYEGRLREAKFYDGNYFDILRYGILNKEYQR